jgi:hypothetical protein
MLVDVAMFCSKPDFLGSSKGWAPERLIIAEQSCMLRVFSVLSFGPRVGGFCERIVLIAVLASGPVISSSPL